MVAEQVADIVILQRPLVPAAPESPPAPAGSPGDPLGHLQQARFAGHRPRPPGDEFHAVVVGRIMAGGDDDAAVDTLRLQAEGGMVDLFGAADPEIEDIGPHFGQTGDQRPATVPGCSAGYRGPPRPFWP